MPPTDLDLSRVLPYLKAVEGRQGDETAVIAGDVVPVTRPFVGQLITTYVIDQGSHFEYVSVQQLSLARNTLDELHQHAVQNLVRRTTEHELRMAQHDAITAVLFDGNFEASMMQLDALWTQVQNQLGQHELLAVAPARDVLAFCPADSVDGQVQLGELVERVWTPAGHRLARGFYRRARGAWVADSA